MSRELIKKDQKKTEKFASLYSFLPSLSDFINKDRNFISFIALFAAVVVCQKQLRHCSFHRQVVLFIAFLREGFRTA